MGRALPRRTALAVKGLALVGVGGAVALDALGHNNPAPNRTAPPFSSADPAQPASSEPVSYLGPVRFTSYSGNIDAALPGTEREKAKDVPFPKEPQGMNENTREGLYRFIGFWLAAHNYCALTGDATAINRVCDAQDQEDAKELTELYAKGAWLASTNVFPFSLSLDSEEPLHGDIENTLTWKCTPAVDPQAHMVGADDTVFENIKSNFAIDTDPLYVIYDQDKWRMTYSLLPETTGNIDLTASAPST